MDTCFEEIFFADFGVEDPLLSFEMLEVMISGMGVDDLKPSLGDCF